MSARDIVEQLQDACDLATDKRELERLCGNAKIEIKKLRAALATLFSAADEFHGEIDKQTYNQKREVDWEIEDDHEFCVTVTAKQDRALCKAILQCERVVPNVTDMTPAEEVSDALVGYEEMNK